MSGSYSTSRKIRTRWKISSSTMAAAFSQDTKPSCRIWSIRLKQLREQYKDTTGRPVNLELLGD